MYKPSIRPNRALLTVLALLLVTQTATALAQPGPLPIRIESDRADLARQSGESNYDGNVVLTRGGLTLTGSHLTVTRINDRGNIRAVLEGSPARLDKQPDRDGDDVITGHSNRIEYTNSDATLIMRGDARVERGGDRITGEVIRHNLDSDRTQAERGSGSDRRVRITIQPPAEKQQ